MRIISELFDSNGNPVPLAVAYKHALQQIEFEKNIQLFDDGQEPDLSAYADEDDGEHVHDQICARIDNIKYITTGFAGIAKFLSNEAVVTKLSLILDINIEFADLDAKKAYIATELRALRLVYNEAKAEIAAEYQDYDEWGKGMQRFACALQFAKKLLRQEYNGLQRSNKLVNKV